MRRRYLVNYRVEVVTYYVNYSVPNEKLFTSVVVSSGFNFTSLRVRRAET